MNPGDTFDRYTILRQIGRGGMGEVYRAHDTRLHRNVALKIVRADPAEAGDTKARGDNVDRLFREARAAAALEHPNVVVIHDVGEAKLEGSSEPVCYIAMELIEGTAMSAFVKEGDVPFDERMRWLIDVARALSFAHGRGIVHRDVKPDNVIIREDGAVKVLDFGIARRSRSPVDGASVGGAVIQTVTEKGMTMGTPRFMAPEQMLNETLDGRADQYAWGLTAYELLSGKSAWAGTTDSVQLIAAVLTRAPDPLLSVAPHVPPEVARVIDRTLSRNRADRYPTMDAVLEALGVAPAPPKSVRHPSAPRFAADEPPEQPTLSAQSTQAAPPASPAPQRWLAWSLGALAAVAIAGGLAVRVTSRHAAPVAEHPVDPNACTTGAQCAQRIGQAAVCRAGACVPLASPDCRVSAAPGDETNDATIWIGAMFPLTGDDAKTFGEREFRAVDLARADFAHMLAGANAHPNGGRPMALLACDDAANPERALHHLVDDVGVPAVIGFRSSNEAIQVATSTLIPKGVMGVAALNTSPILSSLPRPASGRLFWRTTFSGAAMALPIAQLIPDVLEPELRAPPAALAKGDKLRVALVRQDDAAGLGFADALFRVLKFNGVSALENEANYHELVYAPGADAAKFDEVARGVVAFAPNVVVYNGGDGPFAAILDDVERAWPAGKPRPRYLKAASLAPSDLAFVGKSADRRRRLLGFTSVSTTTANARFVARYNEAYSEHVTRTFSPNSSYDAFYVIAYAALALGDAKVTGTALSQAVLRLQPPGKTIDVGPSGIFEGLSELASGRNIDLNGATGRLDFDPETGDAAVDLAVVCVDTDAHGAAVGSRESGMVYDATARVLRGALRCP